MAGFVSCAFCICFYESSEIGMIDESRFRLAPSRFPSKLALKNSGLASALGVSPDIMFVKLSGTAWCTFWKLLLWRRLVYALSCFLSASWKSLMRQLFCCSILASTCGVMWICDFGMVSRVMSSELLFFRTVVDFFLSFKAVFPSRLSEGCCTPTRLIVWRPRYGIDRFRLESYPEREDMRPETRVPLRSVPDPFL